MSAVITRVASISEARLLPPGSIVGDHHGGVTFSDGVAAVLEARSSHGWRELNSPVGSPAWTVILINR